MGPADAGPAAPDVSNDRRAAGDAPGRICVPVARDHAGLDDVQELPDVTRPRRGASVFSRVAGSNRLSEPITIVEQGDKMRSEQIDIGAAFPQRRQMDREVVLSR